MQKKTSDSSVHAFFLLFASLQLVTLIIIALTQREVITEYKTLLAGYYLLSLPLLVTYILLLLSILVTASIAIKKDRL